MLGCYRNVHTKYLEYLLDTEVNCIMSNTKMNPKCFLIKFIFTEFGVFVLFYYSDSFQHIIIKLWSKN